MENLKVKKSKEALDLLFALGGVSKYCAEDSEYLKNENGSVLYLCDGYIWTKPDIEDIPKCKEITLPELRDMVVLKRNDAEDANYTYCGKPVLKLKTQDYKVWNKLDKCWIEHIGSQTDLRAGLKPIEKPMKELKQAEFLVKTDGGYVLQVLGENSGGADVVRIPDGAEIAILSSGVVYFWKSHFFNGGVHKYWVDMKDGWDASWYLKSVPSAITIWQRETLNDQVASAEEYREMISNASILGRASIVVDIAQSCSGGAIRNASSQGQSEFPLNNYELNHRVAKAFNAVRGTDLNEDDVNYIRELINLTISHYGERK